MNLTFWFKNKTLKLKKNLRVLFFSFKVKWYKSAPVYVSPILIFQKKNFDEINNVGKITFIKTLEPINKIQNNNLIRFYGYEYVNKRNDYHLASGFYKLNNAYVYSENAIATGFNDQLFVHTFLMVNKRNIIDYDNMLLRDFKRKKITLKLSSAFLISTEGTSGYYHWVLDSLAKLIMYKNDIVSNEPIIIIPKNNKPFIAESLELYGFSNYIFADKNFHCEVNTLYVPELVSDVGNPRIEALNFLRNTKRMVNSIDKVFSKRIYITRRKQTVRHIYNETQLLEQISPYGFRTYVLEEMTFNDQINLFRNAEIVVAPHGAGLTNILFCQNELKIIELFPSNYFEDCFQNISNLLGFDHHVIIENNGDKNRNFYLDIDNFKRMIDMIL